MSDVELEVEEICKWLESHANTCWYPSPYTVHRVIRDIRLKHYKKERHWPPENTINDDGLND